MFDRLNRPDSHWEYIGLDDRPPPRFPWLRGALFAAAIGSLLGVTTGLRIALGYWPDAAAAFLVAPAAILALTVGVEQLFKTTRRRRADLWHMSYVAAAAFVVASLVSLLVA